MSALPRSSLWEPPPAKIAIFRALNLGDLLCIVPALRALRKAFPTARVTLIGLDSARPVVERFGGYLDDLLLFPGDPAFPEQEPRLAELPAFYRCARERHFDVALQLHGSGGRANVIVEALGARRWAGFVPDHARQEHGRLMAWPDAEPEIHRYLLLLNYLGLRVDGPGLEFPLTPRDMADAGRLAREAGIDAGRTVVIHPGARMASRRWPVERYASVARTLVDDGWQVAITGSQDERDLVCRLLQASGRRLVDLCGRTTLGSLAALLQHVPLLVCNDTGVSHVAAAVGVSSIVIACGSDANRWAPLDKTRHCVLHAPMACRPCMYQECPIGHPCACAIGVDEVVAQARSRLGLYREAP
ncbi:MAG TPA: glycosyltransferase family 9 protein [Candidimonas sp.]|nr:glycosyltransferase family 9 protein [Candidimonas sp.]